ncbi:hypothetical protein GCM10023201_57330 [Actinomycetospora corticicola]
MKTSVGQEQITEGMVVFDTNTLLALYEVGASSRGEILAVLGLLGDRLWLPHQVALEFSRNRRRVVLDRVSRFKKATQSIRSATAEAVDVLEKAVGVVVSLRARNRTARSWSAADVGLDRESLAQRLEGALGAALAEVRALEAEHDLRPVDVSGLDQLFEEVDSLTAGRIGAPPSSKVLRDRVREALDFRYPNRIPPGYLDRGKATELEGAGDYLLWREILDEAKRRQALQSRVLLVTDEEKPDWWVINERDEILHARPELVQEMESEAPGTQLTLISLSAFLHAAREYLAASVSDETVEDVVASVSRDSTYDLDVQFFELLRSRSSAFLDNLRHLFLAMGYSVDERRTNRDEGFDLILIDHTGPLPRTVGVEVKMYSRPVPAQVLDQAVRMASRASVDEVIIVTTGHFSSRARNLAESRGVQLIDGRELRRLHEEWLPREELPLELPEVDDD